MRKVSLVVAAVMAVSVTAASGEPHEPTAVERAQQVVAPYADAVGHGGRGDRGLVILIGENHVNTQSQLEVESTLAALDGASLIDAVGVEGAIGPIDIHSDQFHAGAQRGAETQRDHARNLVKWGQISGADAFALATPSKPYVGIENLGAKQRWEIAEAASSDRELDALGQRRSAEIARAAKCLGAAAMQSPGIAAARTRLAAAERRFTAARRVQSHAMAKLRPLELREAALSDDDDTMVEVRRVNAALWMLELEKRAKDHPGDTTLARDVEHARVTLKRMIPDAATDQVSDRVVKWFAQHQALSQDFDKAVKPLHLDELGEELTSASDAVGDAFAEVASEFSAVDPAGRCNQRLVHFHTQVVPPSDDNAPDLGERDAGMTQRAVKLLGNHRAVAIVVGSKHLPGMSARLRQRGVQYLAVAVKSRDQEATAWEFTTWKQRQAHRAPTFVAGLNEAKEHNKPPSALTDPIWWLNFAERHRVLAEAGGATATRGKVVHQGRHGERVIRDALPGRDATVVIDDIGLGPTVDAGAHVVERGPLPDGRIATVFDTAKARELVAKHSDAQTLFAYARHGDDGASTIVDVPGANGATQAITLRELAAGGAGNGGRKPPRRIVVFDEMDAESSRQLARDLGTPDASGKPAWRGAADESLLFTVNPERAARNLRRLAEQQPDRIGGVQVIRGPGLEGLLPTPARGDHARTVVIIARNEAEFRANVERAARDGLLERKQVALVTCGDAFAQTAELREALLSSGAAMVWVPDRQIPEDLGNTLGAEIERTVNELPADQRGAELDIVMRRTLERMRARGGHPQLRLLDFSKTHVLLLRRVRGAIA